MRSGSAVIVAVVGVAVLGVGGYMYFAGQDMAQFHDASADVAEKQIMCNVIQEQVQNADPSTDTWAEYMEPTPVNTVSCPCTEPADHHDREVIWTAEQGTTSYTGSATLNRNGDTWELVGNPTIWTKNGNVLDTRTMVIGPYRDGLSECSSELPEE